MSRWLSSVGNLLEKLDGQVETAADEVPATTAILAQRFLGNREAYSSDDSYYSEDDEWPSEEELNDDGDGGEEEAAPSQSIDSYSKAFLEEEKMTAQYNKTEADASLAGARGSEPAQKYDTPDELNGLQDFSKKGKLSPDSFSDVSHPSSSEYINAPVVQERSESIQTEVMEPLPDITVTTSAPQPFCNESIQQTRATDFRDSEADDAFLADSPAQEALATSSQSQNASQSKVSDHSEPNGKNLALPPPRSNNTSSKRMLAELQRTQKLTVTLQAQLDAANVEIEAQHKELQNAAKTLQVDRERADEEREDLLDEHEDEITRLKQSYDQQLEIQKKTCDAELLQVTARLQHEQDLRVREGGDWTKELEEALQRERDGLQRLNSIQMEKSMFDAKVSKLETQHDALQKRVVFLNESAEAAAVAARQAEEKLDEAVSSHKRQLAQRQAREAELERTVAELGSVLTRARQAPGHNNAPSSSSDAPKGEYSRDERFILVKEELETVQTQLVLERQRTQALQDEIEEIAKERTSELRFSKEQNRAYDQQIEELRAQVAHLESQIRTSNQGTNQNFNLEDSDDAFVASLQRELSNAKQNIASVSDQLVHQQFLSEQAKSEVLALRGRLQSATMRADEAERSLTRVDTDLDGDSRLYEIEAGGYYAGSKARRRIKRDAGFRNTTYGSRYRILSTRSVSAALGLRGTGNQQIHQIAMTLDALDSWMLETTDILRHEPLVRIGLVTYFLVVHMWCFGLVFFHTMASEHGDLGALKGRGALIQPTPLQHHIP
jgi:hypothetical protein